MGCSSSPMQLSPLVKRPKTVGAFGLKSLYNIGEEDLLPSGEGMFFTNIQFFKVFMKIYVINKDGNPLMPCSPRKARLLLKRGKATVVRNTPFIIQLIYSSSGYKQSVALGVDPGFKVIALSAVSQNQELFSMEVNLRENISKKVSERRMYRRNRRNRLRYRKARFLNRRKSQALAPSIKQKIDAHISLIRLAKILLPITSTIIEAGSFDPHKIKNVEIEGKGYQQGEQYGFENIKSYVLARDSYQCQSGKTGCSKKLQIHHIKFRSNGGSDTPENLVTLCEKHHDQLHKNKLVLSLKPPRSLSTATVMNVIRKQIFESVTNYQETFGYQTKVCRRKLNLKKTHANDAFIIAGGEDQKRSEVRRLFFKRKNNRSLQKNRNGFKPTIRKKRYKIQPYDLVKWKGKKYRAIGIQNKGYYLKMTDGIHTFVKNTKQISISFHQKTLVSNELHM